MTRFLTAVAAALALCGASPAVSPAAGPSGDVTAAALAQAYEAFPDSPCVGRARVVWQRDLDAWAFERFGPIGGALGLYWQGSPCVLYIAARVSSWRLACTVIVHELGHSAGYGHEYEGHHGVMGKRPWPGCDPFPSRAPNPNGWNRPMRRGDVTRAVRRQIGIPSSRMRCKPSSGAKPAPGVAWLCEVYRRGDRRRADPVASWAVRWNVERGRVEVRRP